MDCDASPREQQRARQSHSQQPDIVRPLVGPTTLLTRYISLSYKWVGQGGSQLDIVGPLVGPTTLLTRCISLSYNWVEQGGSQLNIDGPTKLTKYM